MAYARRAAAVRHHDREPREQPRGRLRDRGRGVDAHRAEAGRRRVDRQAGPDPDPECERRAGGVPRLRAVPVGVAARPDAAGPSPSSSARAAKADVVVVAIHAGAEGSTADHVPQGTEYYLGENRGDSRAFTHAVIDAGADLVVGSGPHVIRGVQWYHGHLIAYSLGNLAGWHTFGLGGTLSESAVISVTLRRDGRILGGHWTSLELADPGIPQLDPGDASLGLANQLSKADFGVDRGALHDRRSTGRAAVTSSLGSPPLSPSQLATLAAIGEERTAARRRRALPGRRPPLPVHRDPRGRGGDPRRRRQRDHPPRPVRVPRRDEPALRADRLRDRASATQPLRYIAVDRDALRPLLFEDGPLSDLLLSTFIARREALQRVDGHRLRDRRPALVGGDACAWSSSRARNRAAVHLARPRRATATRPRPSSSPGSTPRACRSSGCPGGAELSAPSPGELLARARHRPRARAARGGRPARRRRRPGRPRRRGLRRLGGPRHAGRREHRARRPGRHVAPDRELPRLPGRHHAAPS